MLPLTQEYLKNCFENAKLGAKYVGVAIQLPGEEEPEVIVNPASNFNGKLKYYQSTYNELLEHNHVAGLCIVGFTYGDSFEEIERDLLG